MIAVEAEEPRRDRARRAEGGDEGARGRVAHVGGVGRVTVGRRAVLHSRGVEGHGRVAAQRGGVLAPGDGAEGDGRAQRAPHHDPDRSR